MALPALTGQSLEAWKALPEIVRQGVSRVRLQITARTITNNELSITGTFGQIGIDALTTAGFTNTTGNTWVWRRT